MTRVYNRTAKLASIGNEIGAVVPGAYIADLVIESRNAALHVSLPDEVPAEVWAAVDAAVATHDPTKLTPAETQNKAMNENRAKHKGKSYKTMNKPDQDDLILAMLQSSGWADENGVVT